MTVHKASSLEGFPFKGTLNYHNAGLQVFPSIYTQLINRHSQKDECSSDSGGFKTIIAFSVSMEESIRLPKSGLRTFLSHNT